MVMDKAMKAFSQVVKKVASEENVILADAESRVPKDVQHFVDDCHYTVEGKRLLAETVLEAIIESKIIDKRFKNKKRR